MDFIEEFVDAENWPDLLSPDALFDREKLVVIDACDQVKAKSAMAAWAIKNRVSLISVGAAGGKRLAHRVDIDDLSQVTHDPLLAQMRYRLRKEHGAARVGKMGVMCVFSREEVMKPSTKSALNQQINSAQAALTAQAAPLAQTDGTLNCHGYGSIVCVTSTFGMCAASWALNKIAGIF